jgi:chromosome partitioning protein
MGRTYAPAVLRRALLSRRFAAQSCLAKKDGWQLDRTKARKTACNFYFFLYSLKDSKHSCLFSCFRHFFKFSYLPIRLSSKHEKGLSFMHVIVLASQKGGSGKTTLTGNLAIAAELAGHGPAVLIDTDPQGSLAAWWNVRKSESPVFAAMTAKEREKESGEEGMKEKGGVAAELKSKLASLEEAGYALAFVDTPPAIADAIKAVMEQAHLVLIPTRPSPHDLRAVGSTVGLVQEQGKPFVFVVTQAKANTRLVVQAMAALSAHGTVAPAIVHDRIDYAASMIDGRTVQETDPHSRSAAEIGELWEFVHERLHKSTEARKEQTT